jgi:hypothetical protein
MLPGSKKPTGRALLLALAGSLMFLLPARAANDSVPLEDILKRSGKIVERFWEQYPEVNCNETVRQAKLEKNGKVIYEQESQFDYLVLVEMTMEELGVTESRQAVEQPRKRKNIPLLVTNGFSTMLLVFHPYYQEDFEFARLTDQWVDGKQLLRIHFQHVKGARSPSALELRGRDYPIDWEGTAWIEPETWAIRRIEADLMDPMEDVGLLVLHSDVRYGPVRFSSSPETYWLPQVAEIEVETKHQHWRNVHQFNGYKRFSTDSKEEIKAKP